MKKDDTVYLLHILDAIELIDEYTKGMSEIKLSLVFQSELISVWDTIKDDLPLLKRSIKKIL